MKQKIKEIIVVEGKNDTNVLQSYFDCDTIETGGDQVNEGTLERIEEAQRQRGVIIFTDPDTPGEHIRRLVKARVPEAKHAFIQKEKARTTKKVGVEHAEQKDLWDALSHCVTFISDQESLSWQDYIELGCIGNKKYRFFICEKLHIGPCNAKTCFKRLNQMGITKEEIQNILKEVDA